MGIFHYDPVEGVNFLGNLPNWMMYLKIPIVRTYVVYVLHIFLGGLICFWLMYIIIVVFCKSVSCEHFSCF